MESGLDIKLPFQKLAHAEQRILSGKGRDINVTQINEYCRRINWSLYALWRSIFHISEGFPQSRSAGTDRIDHSSRERREWSALRSPFRVGFVVPTALGFGAFAITTVEVTIARNRIDLSRAPLTSTG